jgi:hypothetical protein
MHIADGLPMDCTDIVNACRERKRGEDIEGSDSSSLVRMRELGVKINTARHEKYARNMRGLVNQHRTGTIS